MRGDGLFRRGEVWWMTYVTPDGTRHRASTGKRYHEEAKTERNRILGEIAHGRPVVVQGKVTLEELGDLIEADYKMRGHRSLDRAKGALKQLKAYFGRQPAASIQWDDTMQYREFRSKQGRAPATVNYELAILRHMLRLAVKARRLVTLPVIETPDPENARTGFFERDEFEAVAAKLPEAYAAIARFTYCTGWRTRSEVLRLRWDQVDFLAGVVRLEANTTKSGEGRTFTFDVLPELVEVLTVRRTATDEVIRKNGKRVPWVFHEGGQPIPYKKLLKAWNAALEAAEVAPRYLHDFRRTAARNLRRAGVDEGTIMKLCGWKTRSMFDRYNIIDERDLRAGVEKLARVTVESQSGGSSAGAAS